MFLLIQLFSVFPSVTVHHSHHILHYWLKWSLYVSLHVLHNMTNAFMNNGGHSRTETWWWRHNLSLTFLLSVFAAVDHYVILAVFVTTDTTVFTPDTLTHYTFQLRERGEGKKKKRERRRGREGKEGGGGRGKREIITVHNKTLMIHTCTYTKKFNPLPFPLSPSLSLSLPLLTTPLQCSQ